MPFPTKPPWRPQQGDCARRDRVSRPRWSWACCRAPEASNGQEHHAMATLQRPGAPEAPRLLLRAAPGSADILIRPVDQLMVRLVVVGEKAPVTTLDAVGIRLVLKQRGISGIHRSIDVVEVHQVQCFAGDPREMMLLYDEPPQHARSTLGNPRRREWHGACRATASARSWSRPLQAGRLDQVRGRGRVAASPSPLQGDHSRLDGSARRSWCPVRSARPAAAWLLLASHHLLPPSWSIVRLTDRCQTRRSTCPCAAGEPC